VNQIKLYFDEDAMHSRLVTALRSRGVVVVTVMDAGLTEKTDEEQLAFAIESGCVLYTTSRISIDLTPNGSVPDATMPASFWRRNSVFRSVSSCAGSCGFAPA
jgi:hypothetical protein